MFWSIERNLSDNWCIHHEPWSSVRTINRRHKLCHWVGEPYTDSCRKKWGITELECLALVWACMHFSHYQLAMKFEVRSDHHVPVKRRYRISTRQRIRHLKEHSNITESKTPQLTRIDGKRTYSLSWRKILEVIERKEWKREATSQLIHLWKILLK